MYIRVRKSIYKSGKTVNHYQLVESYRKDGKVISKAICTLGSEPTVEGAIKKFSEYAATWRRIVEKYCDRRDHSYVPGRCRKALDENIIAYKAKASRYEGYIFKLNEYLCSVKVISTAKQA